MSGTGDRAMRLVVALNDRVRGCQEGVYVALDRLMESGRVDSAVVYPFLARLGEGARPADIERELCGEIRESRANALLWAHTSKLALDEAALKNIRAALQGGPVGYWEGDWYTGLSKPLPMAARTIMAHSDVVFLPGDGGLTRLVKRVATPDVRYVPTTTDHRFEPVVASQRYEVVMVANRVRSRVPFRSLAGTRTRENLVRVFARELGEDFRVFGRGWSGPSAGGEIPISSLAEVYGSSRVVLGVNHCDARYCFSDRLPIAMSCGRPVVYREQSGYDELFGSRSGVYWFSTAEGALERYREVVANPAEATERAAASRAFACANLTTERALEYMIEVLESYLCGQAGTEVQNPWVRGVRL